MALLTVNKATIHYEYHPAKNKDSEGVLVLIHGYLSSSFSFRYLIPFLTQRYSVASLDLPGFGKSEKSKGFHYSMAQYAKTVLALMDHLKIDKASLIGHSMGGQIALQTAKLFPKRMNKVVLLAASGYLKPFNRWLVLASYLPFFPWIVKKGFEKRNAKQLLLQVVYDSKLIDQSMIDGYVHPMLEKNFYHALVRLLRHHGGDLLSEQLKNIQTPILLIWGKEDRIVPLNVGERLSQDLPNSSLKVYEQTGHLVPEERPGQIYRDIRKFHEL